MKRLLAATFVAILLDLVVVGCCSTFYRYDGKRYYKKVECPWGGHVECDSATRLPDPATWTGGCR
jgi:hypothetical protein